MFAKFAHLVNENVKSILVDYNVTEMKDRKPVLNVVNKSGMGSVYLAAFPEGTDPLYRVRSTHDCNCCLDFLRDIGGLVRVEEDLGLRTIWQNYHEFPAPYDVVAKALHEEVLARSGHLEPFLPEKINFGKQFNIDPENGERHDHFFYDGTELLDYEKAHKLAKHSAAKVRTTVKSVLHNGNTPFTYAVRNFKKEAFDSVAKEIDNGLYRGDQYRGSFTKVREALANIGETLEGIDPKLRSRFLLCEFFKDVPLYSGVRSSPIFKFVESVSEGKAFEDALAEYLRMVDPANYHNSSRIISDTMVRRANNEIKEMGLDRSLERRAANILDLDVNSLLFLNRDTSLRIEDAMGELSPLDKLALAKGNTPVGRDAPEIRLENFKELLRGSKSCHVLSEPRHRNNLVSMTTAKNPEAPPLFKWSSHLGWTYRGGFSDAIKERVKKAGGKIDGDLRVSLSWGNVDDLDLFVYTPSGGKICYYVKRAGGGELDIDMNCFQPVKDPVENVVFVNGKNTAPGKYVVHVNNFNKRTNADQGFQVEIADREKSMIIFCENNPTAKPMAIATFEWDKEVFSDVKLSSEGLSFHEGTSSGELDQTFWGLPSCAFVPVRAIMEAPGSVGHTFLIIEGCHNPDPIRSLAVEYLRPELYSHRRVLANMADALPIPPTEDQLSGYGFINTAKNNFIAKLDGTIYKVLVG